MSVTPEFDIDSIPINGSRIEFAFFDEISETPKDPRDGGGKTKPQGWKCYLCRVFVPAGTFHSCSR